MRADGQRDPGRFFEEAAAPFFPDIGSDRLQCLGRLLFRRISGLLRRCRLPPGYEWDGFHEAIVDFLTYAPTRALRVRNIEAWVLAIGHNAGCHLVRKLRSRGGEAATELPWEEVVAGDGEFRLPISPPLTIPDDTLQEITIAALDALDPRLRDLANRLFILCEPREKVKLDLGIDSERTFSRLQRKALNALVESLSNLLAAVGVTVA